MTTEQIIRANRASSEAEERNRELHQHDYCDPLGTGIGCKSCRDWAAGRKQPPRPIVYFREDTKEDFLSSIEEENIKTTRRN
jgi:hypothetical protein